MNVPGVGETTRNYPGLVAPDIAAAIALAVAGIIVEPVQVTKTA